jgi:hypothetical protein
VAIRARAWASRDRSDDSRDRRYLSRVKARQRNLALLALCVALAAPLAAKELAAEQGASIDMPSGFIPGDGDGRTRFSYFDPAGEMELDIIVYEPERFSTAAAMAADAAAKLGSQGDASTFSYEGRSASISELSFTLGGVARRGYALFVAGRAGEADYALLAHVASSRFDAYGEYVISCLDSFSIDRAARRQPGPVSQFLLPWPPERASRKRAVLPAGSVDLPWSPAEAAQELDVAVREYRILARYAKTDTLWVDAWARFYRMAYRESAARLDGLTEAFARSLPLDDPTECARRVLAWVQGFTDAKDDSGIDFVPPLPAAFERRGDCDARAVVMAIILERLGIDCVLMVSREYSHAMVGVDVPGGGQRFPFNGRNYLVAETTARVGIGLIDAEQADFSKWLGVDVGN